MGDDRMEFFDTVFTVVLFAAFGTILFTSRHIRPFLFQRKTAFAFGCLGIVGCALLACESGTEESRFAPIGIIGLVLTTLFLASYLVLWGARSCQGDCRETIVCILLSYILYHLLLLAAVALGHNLSLLSPLVLTATLCISWRPSDSMWLGPRESVASIPWALVVPTVALTYLGIALLDTFTALFTVPPLTCADVLASLAIAAVFTLIMAVFTIRRPYAPSIFVLMLGVLVVIYAASFLILFLTSDAYRMASGVKHLLDVYLWLVVACTVVALKVSPIVAFAGYGLIVLAIRHLVTFGMTHGTGVLWRVLQSSMAKVIVAAGLFMLVVICVTLLLAQYHRSLRRTQSTDAERIRELCRQSTEGLGLTSREFDVLVATYRGHSAKKIADTLCLAESTVKGNRINAYRKLGVHSKQELIDFIDQHRAG